MLIALALAAATPAPEQYGPTEPSPPENLIPDTYNQRLPKENRCTKTWRLISYAAHAADIASTIAALESNPRAREANPMVKAIFGSRPKPHELVAFKVGYIGLTEVFSRNMNPKHKCLSYKV